jgi:hypothetical protein
MICNSTSLSEVKSKAFSSFYPLAETFTATLNLLARCSLYIKLSSDSTGHESPDSKHKESATSVDKKLDSKFKKEFRRFIRVTG